jgi:DNA-3-methyladenine glycosylase
MKLERSFYLRPAQEVAKALLGKILTRRLNNTFLKGKIVETEAYLGAVDRASHSYGWKRTPRNKAEYFLGGHIYIYLCYGMYWQFNITTGEAGNPECVLIRALEPIRGLREMRRQRKVNQKRALTSGPGKLCQAFGLNGEFYGVDLCTSQVIYLEEGEEIPPQEIEITKRIGIDYAGEWKDKPLRFYIKGNLFVSKF